MTPPVVLRAIWAHFTASPRSTLNVRWIRAACGAVILFRALTASSQLAELWGPDGFAPGLGFPEPHAHALARVFSSMAVVRGLWALHVVAGLALLLGKFDRIASVAALLLGLLFNHRLPELCDGGDGLLALILMFSLPCRSTWPEGQRPFLRVVLHNCGVTLLELQCGLMYFAAGVSKASSRAWMNGTATYSISRVELYSVEALRDLFADPFVATFTSVGTAVFQVVFPVLLFTRGRRLALVGAFALHAWTAMTMGLLEFAAVAMALDLVLFTEAELASIRRWLSGPRSVGVGLPVPVTKGP